MNGVPRTGESDSSFATGPRDSTIDCKGAQLRAHARSVATVVTVVGEVDASNVHRVSEHLRRFMSVGKALVLDLSGVTFLGLQAVRDLSAFDDECGRAGVACALVASGPVRHMLDVADPNSTLPSVSSVAEALQLFRNPARDRLLVQLAGNPREGRDREARKAHLRQVSGEAPRWGRGSSNLSE